MTRTTVKVLVTCSKYPPEYAGSGLRAHRTYLRLRSKYQIEAEVICSSLVRTAWLNETYEIDRVRVTRISSPFKRGLLRARASGHRLRKLLWYVLGGLDECTRTLGVLLLRGHRFDSVHTFGHCWSAGIVAIWAGVLGKPILRELVTMRSRPDDPPGLRMLVRWALRRRGLVIAISPLLAERARQLGYPRVWCRPNPVDEQRFQVDRVARAEVRQRCVPFAPEDVILLDISKYAPLKNKELLIRMMPLLPQRYKLLTTGPLEPLDQPLYQQLQNLAIELRVQDRVRLEHGFLEHPEQYLRMADVFLFPSLSDGLGTSVLEAMCSGIPVVAHRIPGVTDWWIRDGENGILCGATPEEFASGVQRALEIPRARLEETAHRLVEQVSTSTIDAAYVSHLRHAIRGAIF